MGARLFSKSGVTVIGVLNTTPDSFSDGGRFVGSAGQLHLDAAVAEGEALARAGADVIDIGGESTRPGAAGVSVADEIGRTRPVVEALAKRVPTPISIDTRKAEVAEAALLAGASIVNDVSGLHTDKRIAKLVCDHGAWIILGHLRGSPRTMQDAPHFDDLLGEVAAELQDSVRFALEVGISRDRIVADPGLGFGKTAEDTLRLLANVGWLRAQLELPVLVGASRKSFLGAVTGAPVSEREFGSAAANAIGIFSGADAIRVHDVASAVEVARVARALRDALRESHR